MKTKPTTHGSPWTQINEVEKVLNDRINELTGHLQAIDGRIAKLEKPETKSVQRRKKVQKAEKANE